MIYRRAVIARLYVYPGIESSVSHTEMPVLNTELPSFAKDELRRIWDTIAPHYDAWAWMEDYLIGTKRLRRRLMRQASGRILDVACGTGRNFRYFPPDSQVAAVDLSAGMIAEAQKQADKLGISADLHVMDAEKLAFPDNHFDTVVSAHATCTIPDPVAALREMGRVCRDSGRILLMEHGQSTWKLWRWYQAYNPRLFYGSGCRWNQDTLELLRLAGLDIVSAQRAFFGIMYVIVAKPGSR
jgi:SAM-dependent methyltransferase